MLNVVFLLLLIAIVALVAAQNAVPVVVTFLGWGFEASLSVIIFLSVFVGILIAAIFILSGYVKRLVKNKRSRPEEDIHKKDSRG